VLYGLEALRDIYLERKDDHCFARIGDAIRNLQGRGRNSALHYYNGFFVREHEVDPLYRDVNLSVFSDNEDFKTIYNPLIDE
jgi:hypothetical protein